MDDDNGQAADVSDLYDELGLRDVLPRGLLDALTVDGGIYRVPVAVSGGNVLWSDRRVLADVGLDPDAAYASVDEWIVALRAVKAAGRDPIALGPWWTRQLLLENVLLSELGRDAYQGLWDGSTSWDAAEVVEAFRDFDTIVSLDDTGDDSAEALEQDWTVQADRFADHGAAFLVMGDWAQARFVAAHRLYRTDYDAVAMPGTEGSVLLAGLDGNTFAMRDGAPHPDGARAWLGVLASREGQSVLARTLGEVPARTDVDPSGFDRYTREAMSRLRDGTVIDSFTLGTRLGPEASVALEEAGRRYTNHRAGIDALRRAVAGAAAGGAR
jgi:glucose/mannose transport system substrate-binding protein